MLKLLVVSDHNDADYLSAIHDIKPAELEKLKPLIKAIKGKKNGSRFRHNWPRGEYGYRPDLGEKSVEELYGKIVSQEVIDMMDELVPTSEGNVHTIESITVLEVSKENKLL